MKIDINNLDVDELGELPKKEKIKKKRDNQKTTQEEPKKKED